MIFKNIIVFLKKNAVLNKATENKKIINKNLYALVIVKQSQKILSHYKKKTH